MSERAAGNGFVDHDGIRFAREASGGGGPLVLLQDLGGHRPGTLELARPGGGQAEAGRDAPGGAHA